MSKYNILFLYQIHANKLISTVKYSSHADNVEWVQHNASVDARKCLKPGGAGEWYKPVCCVDRPFICKKSLLHLFLSHESSEIFSIYRIVNLK